MARGEGYTLLSADYSQIELRIMASISGDPAMKAAFEAGEDIHAATAAHVYKVDLNEVTSDMRRRAKTVNFGVMYGISAFGPVSHPSKITWIRRSNPLAPRDTWKH